MPYNQTLFQGECIPKNFSSFALDKYVHTFLVHTLSREASKTLQTALRCRLWYLFLLKSTTVFAKNEQFLCKISSCFHVNFTSLSAASIFDSLNNRYKGSGGNKKLPLSGICTAEIVRKFRLPPAQLPPQTSSPWCTVCPSHGVGSMDQADPSQETSSARVCQGRCCLVLYKSIN